jgi:hypothetical protein
LLQEFGTNHFYNVDTFNEMRPVSSEPAYLSQVAHAVYAGLAAAGNSQSSMSEKTFKKNSKKLYETALHYAT